MSVGLLSGQDRDITLLLVIVWLRTKEVAALAIIVLLWVNGLALRFCLDLLTKADFDVL